MSIESLITAYSREAIIVLAIFASLVITIIYKLFTNKEKMAYIKSRQKELQEEMKKHKGNNEKMLEIQKEMLEQTMTAFKHSLVPMFITFVPVIIFFGWVRSAFASTPIASSWIWYYLVTSLVSSMIFRKLFKMS